MIWRCHTHVGLSSFIEVFEDEHCVKSLALHGAEISASAALLRWNTAELKVNITSRCGLTSVHSVIFGVSICEQLLGYQVTFSFVPIKVQFRVVSCRWFTFNFHLVAAVVFTSRIIQTGSWVHFDWIFLCDPPLFLLLFLFFFSPNLDVEELRWRKTHGLSKQFRVHCKLLQLGLCEIPAYHLTASQLCSANAAEMLFVHSSVALLRHALFQRKRLRRIYICILHSWAEILPVHKVCNNRCGTSSKAFPLLFTQSSCLRRRLVMWLRVVWLFALQTSPNSDVYLTCEQRSWTHSFYHDATGASTNDTGRWFLIECRPRGSRRSRDQLVHFESRLYERKCNSLESHKWDFPTMR